MSKYNSYARRLDSAFREAREEYTKRYNKLVRAKEELETKGKYQPGEAEHNWKCRKAEYEAKFAAANADVKNCDSWAAFKKEAESLRESLNREIVGDGCADPGALDVNALELMKAGILTVEDFENFAVKYDTNPTMLKLISKFAGEKAKTTEKLNERERLMNVERITAEGKSEKMTQFENMIEASMIYGGLTRSNNTPDFIVMMSSKWDELARAIENF